MSVAWGTGTSRGGTAGRWPESGQRPDGQPKRAAGQPKWAGGQSAGAVRGGGVGGAAGGERADGAAAGGRGALPGALPDRHQREARLPPWGDPCGRRRQQIEVSEVPPCSCRMLFSCSCLSLPCHAPCVKLDNLKP